MADTFTAVLSLTKPEVGASADTWGTKLNDNLDDVDALFQSGPALKVANGGTAATTASGARTNLGLGTMATQDASAVAITGGAATLGTFGISSDNPTLVMTESGADADETLWRVSSNAGQFYIAAINDAVTVQNSAVTIDRSGATVDSIALAATAVTINGNAVHTAGTFAAPSSGSFTVELASATSGGTTYASGTAYWQKFGKTVTLRLPAGLKSASLSGNTYAFLRGLPADIVSATTLVTQTVSAAGENSNTYSTLLIEIFNGSVTYMRVRPADIDAAGSFSGTSPGFFDGGAVFTYFVAD